MNTYLLTTLTKKAFEVERIQNTLAKAYEKGLNPKVIKRFCEPNYRGQIIYLIATNSYNIEPPREALIPKDGKKNEYRTVYINSPVDRVICSLYNDAMCELFSSMIHSSCKSYQKNLGVSQVVTNISKYLGDLKCKPNETVLVKTDFSKFFDSVLIQYIDMCFNKMESLMNYQNGEAPDINMFRRYYHSDIYFDLNGNVCKKYRSLQQGCAIGSFLANACLYELDEFMSKKYAQYVRYSDDCLIQSNNPHEVMNDINGITNKYGVVLNPEKVKAVKYDEWVKFLGFNIKQGYRTLSSPRVVKFKNKIKELTVNQRNITMKKATRNVMNYLYGGEHCWADSCLATINVEEDIRQLNLFVLDCIKACGTNKKRIGGIGSTLDKKDYTIVRGKGRNVSSNKEKEENIENYLSMICLWNALRQSESLYKSLLLQVGM